MKDFPADEALQKARQDGAKQMRALAADVVKHLSHEDGWGMGSQRIEQAILRLALTEDP
jgi:hypothetical protein